MKSWSSVRTSNGLFFQNWSTIWVKLNQETNNHFHLFEICHLYQMTDTQRLQIHNKHCLYEAKHTLFSHLEMWLGTEAFHFKHYLNIVILLSTSTNLKLFTWKLSKLQNSYDNFIDQAYLPGKVAIFVYNIVNNLVLAEFRRSAGNPGDVIGGFEAPDDYRGSSNFCVPKIGSRLHIFDRWRHFLKSAHGYAQNYMLKSFQGSTHR